MKSPAFYMVNEIMSWLWNFFIWGITFYYVFEEHESGWWFLIPMCFTATRNNKDNDDV